MKLQWEYPLYLVPQSGGYVSLVDDQRPEGAVHLLAVFTELEYADRFIQRFQLESAARPIKNGREFTWLLERLSAPVTEVAFDPDPREQQINASWSVTITELTEHHLEVDLSPWNYPAYVIAQESGFASIHGQATDGRPLTAIGLFTSRDKALAYLKSTSETGTLCKLANLDQARRFLGGLALEVFAVALDPTVQDDQRRAKHCFDIATLMEKYLVRPD